MDNDQDNVRRIFGEAADLRDEELAAFLEEACGADEQLRASVERLLKHDAEVGSFMDAPVIAQAPTLDQPITEKPGTLIGRYKLLEQIGEGGFGVVFMAEQQEPVRRKVALKIIKPGMDTKEVIARFEAERQALAIMDHPNIAKVLDAGATESGRPFFVMELVRGIQITDFCDQNSLTARERLELFVWVCQAVQHAHQKGIIHRDIKPSNVLVTMHDDKPVPKVIDFGVAKATNARLTERTLFTRFAQMVGTPLYMSPEQAQMSGLDVDTRSDIYSLGVLLYELLTGTTPFDQNRIREAAYDELLRIIREEEPPKPSLRISTLGDTLPSVAAHRKLDPKKLSAMVRGELDWIVMKALEKDRTRRYETATSFSADIERYLCDETVQACPPSAGYRLRKYARRNKAAILTISVVVAALMIGIAGTTWQAVRATQEHRGAELARREEAGQRVQAEQQRDRALTAEQRAEEQATKAETAAENERRQRRLAEEQEVLARRNLYTAHMNLAFRALQDRHMRRGLQLLETHLPQPRREDFRSFEWHYLWRQWHKDSVTLPQLGFFQAVAFSPDNSLLAVADGSRSEIILWDVSAGKIRTTLSGHRGGTNPLAFSPNGRTLASGSYRASPPGEVKLWDVNTGEELAVLKGHTCGIHSIAFSPDGKTLASASSGGYDAHDIRGEIKLWSLDTLKEQVALNAHTKGVTSVVFSPDGELLASGSWDGTIRLWNPTNGEESRRIDVPPGESEAQHNSVNTLAFSPDGRTLADAGGRAATVRLWDVGTGRPIGEIRPQGANNIFSVGFSPDDDLLAMACRDGTVRIWDISAQEERVILQGHSGWVWHVAFSPNGKYLASASGGLSGAIVGTVRLLKVENALPEPVPSAHSHLWAWQHRKNTLGRQVLTVSPDSRSLAIANADKGVTLWNMDTKEELIIRDAHGDFVLSLEFSPDGDVLATGSSDGMLNLWDPLTGRKIAGLPHPGRVTSVVFSPDKETLAAVSGTNVALWDFRARERRRALTGSKDAITSLAFSPDGKRLAAGSIHPGGRRGPAEVLLWNVQTGEVVDSLSWIQQITKVAYSPDGKTLVTCGGDWFRPLRSGGARVCDARTGSTLATLEGQSGFVAAAAYSPDGKILATGSGDGSIKLWDTTTWEERGTLIWGPPVDGLVFSQDGRTLAASADSGEIQVWRAAKPDGGVDQQVAAESDHTPEPESISDKQVEQDQEPD